MRWNDLIIYIRLFHLLFIRAYALIQGRGDRWKKADRGKSRKRVGDRWKKSDRKKAGKESETGGKS